MIRQSRIDLGRPDLRWVVSQQPPTDHADVNGVDVVADIARLAAADEHLTHLKVFDLPPQREQRVLDTEGVVRLGDLLAAAARR
jgi:hypothetical protein